MKPEKIRSLLGIYGKIDRIYLVPEGIYYYNYIIIYIYILFILYIKIKVIIKKELKQEVIRN